MLLLYLDDSGSVRNPADSHVILAGLSVFQTKPYWLTQELDRIAARVWPEDHQTIEFRGSDMNSGRKHWRGIEKADRMQAFRDALDVLARDRSVTLFGAAIHKAAISPGDPMEYAFEQLCNRFDRYLLRLHRAGRTERGLIVLDKSSYETSLQGLATEFRVSGHSWGRLRNIAEVPLFVDSRATRLIQFADLTAYALRPYFENGDADLFDRIEHRFDGEGGTNHGLVHYVPPDAQCNCKACRQRARG